MLRHCSFHILHCCIFSYLLMLRIFSNEVETVTAEFCDENGVTKCANLGNISAPFGGSTKCAASDSFVISNCSSRQPSWKAFEDAVHYEAGNTDLGGPKLLGLERQNFYTYINLTWNIEMAEMSACTMLFPSNDVDLFLPDVINLTTFANGSLQFSPYNYYLLFDCANVASDSDVVAVESPICGAYKEQCGSDLRCAQLKPFQELGLRATLTSLSCSRFMFLATSNLSISLPQGRSSTIQLMYGDLKCEACFYSGGSCSYNKDTHKFEQCTCAMNSLSDTDCVHLTTSGCSGVFCKASAKIGIVVWVTILSLAIMLILPICVFKTVLERPQQSTSYIRPNLSILRDLEGLTERPVEYSYSSIAFATKSFSTVIGEGGFGVVYGGTLCQSGSTQKAEGSEIHIAVKVLEVRSKHTKNQFLNEVGTIGRIHHVNVVRLLGFCVQEDHEMLVYEYVANGSLDRWLFNGRKDGEDVIDEDQKFLDWSRRYAIAVGVARGLSYLHEECRHRTVHCDIKPQNILLDAAMNPKIADFGLSRLINRDESQVVTFARGTPGYMAPEFWRGGESRLSTKFDVYSYGMVLLELISGRRNFAYDDSMGSMCCFPAVAFEAAMQGNVAAILDARLMQAYAHEDVDEGLWNQIWTVAFVALWCIQDHPASRPSMTEVVQYLEGKIALSKNVPQPSMSTTPALAPVSIHSQSRQDLTPISSVGR